MMINRIIDTRALMILVKPRLINEMDNVYR
jgi:hypothetical protein